MFEMESKIVKILDYRLLSPNIYSLAVMVKDKFSIEFRVFVWVLFVLETSLLSPDFSKLCNSAKLGGAIYLAYKILGRKDDEFFYSYIGTTR